MKTSSLIGISYDLLAYHGSGSDGLFERCFEKASNFVGCDWNDELLKKRRRWAYHFLRCNGYIEVVRSLSKWSVSPPSLVECKDKIFLLIGGTREREKLLSTASKGALREIVSKFNDNQLPQHMSFFPSILELKASKAEAIQIAKEIDVNISFDYQQCLFKYLPSLDHVLNAVLTKLPTKPVFEANAAKYFDTARREWIPFSGLYPEQPGLYRNDPRFSRPSYYCATSSDAGLEVFFVQDREWAIIFLCAFSGIKLSMQYRIDNGQITVDASGFEELRLPTLLERCLRSGSLMEPTYTSNGMVYENIRYANLWRLVSKFPVFSLVQKYD